MYLVRDLIAKDPQHKPIDLTLKVLNKDILNHSNCFILVRFTVNLESIAGTPNENSECGHTLDQSAHPRHHTISHSQTIYMHVSGEVGGNPRTQRRGRTCATLHRQ